MCSDIPPSKPGKPCRSQAGGSSASRTGEAQQASATRATMTTVDDVAIRAMGKAGSQFIRDAVHQALIDQQGSNDEPEVWTV